MENREEITIVVQDLRTSRMCKKGTEVWFKKHNLDFKDFCANGISSHILGSFDDAMATKVIDAAHERRAKK